MFEHHHQPLLARGAFIGRILRHLGIGAVMLLVALGIGIAGYHGLEHQTWLDALVNAAMILGGMGPVSSLTTAAGKVFAAAYALFSGIVFLVTIAVLLAPIVHRVMHRFHLEEDEKTSGD